MSNPFSEFLDHLQNAKEVTVFLVVLAGCLGIVSWIDRMPGTEAGSQQRSAWIEAGLENLISFSLPASLSFVQNPIFILIFVLIAGFLIYRSLKSNSGPRRGRA